MVFFNESKLDLNMSVDEEIHIVEQLLSQSKQNSFSIIPKILNNVWRDGSLHYQHSEDLIKNLKDIERKLEKRLRKLYRRKKVITMIEKIKNWFGTMFGSDHNVCTDFYSDVNTNLEAKESMKEPKTPKKVAKKAAKKVAKQPAKKVAKPAAKKSNKPVTKIADKTANRKDTKPVSKKTK